MTDKDGRSSKDGSGQQGPDPAAEALRRATKSAKPAKARKGRKSSPQASSDPELVGSALERLLRDQGWSDRSAVATLMGDWEEIAGSDLAGHVVPVSFEDGTLVLQADSTTWATQVRLLLPQVQQAIAGRVGKGVVDRITVLGPAAPNWTRGPRRVKGRGPRDTYG